MWQIFKIIMSKLGMLIDTWILHKHTTAINEHNAATGKQTKQTVYDAVKHAETVTDIIDNLNKLKCKK